MHYYVCCCSSRCVHTISESVNFLLKLGAFPSRRLSSGLEVNSCSHLWCKQSGSWWTEGIQQGLGMGACHMRWRTMVSAHSAVQPLPYLLPVTMVHTSPWERSHCPLQAKKHHLLEMEDLGDHLDSSPTGERKKFMSWHFIESFRDLNSHVCQATCNRKRLLKVMGRHGPPIGITRVA